MPRHNQTAAFFFRRSSMPGHGLLICKKMRKSRNIDTIKGVGSGAMQLMLFFNGAGKLVCKLQYGHRELLQKHEERLPPEPGPIARRGFLLISTVEHLEFDFPDGHQYELKQNPIGVDIAVIPLMHDLVPDSPQIREPVEVLGDEMKWAVESI